MNPQSNQLLANPEDFPPLPAIGQKIEQAVDSPESSFEDIAEIIQGDESLSQRLLKLANSRFYDYPIEISNIPDALSIIGLRNTRNLSIALSSPCIFKSHSDEFWKHCIAVGLCARLMALEKREPNTERHFIAGFFHKIGRPLLARMYPLESQEILIRTQKRDTFYSTIAERMLGFDDAAVGSAALHHWRFHENITTIVRYYNKPVLARNYARGVSLIHIANFVVSAIGIGDSGDRFVPEFSEAAWGYSEFEESKIHLVVDELLSQIDSVCQVFLEPTPRPTAEK